ncbi:DUF7064 domain-containing protein [Mycolicibacterium thermoresistibile]
MQPTKNDLIQRPTDLTADWLTDVLGLGRVTDFAVERIGTGQMSECYRVTLTWAEGEGDGRPASVVLKVAASDPTSRQTGLSLGLYEREVRFYTDIAPRLPAGPVAPCYHAAYDPDTGAFDLLLGDAAPAVVGDEIRGASPDRAKLALTELGKVHAPLLGDPTLGGAEWLNREAPISQALLAQLYTGFVERYGDQLEPAHREVCERLVASFDDYLAAEAAGSPHGLVHGDFRLDNMLFGEPGADRPLTAVDWQTVAWGPALTDVAYFLGCALRVEDRRAHYDELLRAYHEALGPDPALTLEEVRDRVRRQAFAGVVMAVVPAMLVERTERGDEMFMTLLARHCEHVLDTAALDILPAPTSPEPLQPRPDDEFAHQPTDEPLWNESWYFDFVDAEQGVGGWVRLGLMPNEKITWINALLCGPDMPTIAITEWDAPPPDDPFDIRTATSELVMEATDPLRTYRVTVRGRGQAYDDPEVLLAGGTGEPVELTFDLVWTSAGTPYQYRITPRFEIPCTVSGTVTAGDRSFTIEAVPGQRDHSWGVRDWWGMEWVWSALHLHDGTRLHGVDVRIPEMGPVGIGYIQPPGEPLIELAGVTARESIADTGLPVGTTIELTPGIERTPGDVSVDVDIRGHAPVRLTAPDGRVSHFPRAWCTVTTGDGRTGVGWVEWNRVLP